MPEPGGITPAAAGNTPVRIACSVAYATPERQFLWTFELPAGACVADAIAAARGLAVAQDAGLAAKIPWESAPVGVFGEARKHEDPLRTGDRVELYRPLPNDPRGSRRERVRRARAARPRGS
jgi:putative ubiquitin-RnfH superfamily antitoxin RatB of RatAB toxin-antitoxin module